MQKITQKRIKEIVKLKQKKYRKQFKKVVVNGERIVNQIIDNGVWPEEIYLTCAEDAHIYYEKKLQNVFEVSAQQMRRISNNETPQKVSALFRIVPVKIKSRKKLLYLDKINDPGNLGTILRTAISADFDGVILSSDCVDPFNQKVINASMGAVFSFPFEVMTADELLSLPNQKIVTCLENAENIYEFKPEKSFVLIIGSEARGISESLIKNSDKRITVPMTGKMESLNVAVAAGIAMSYLNYKSRENDF
ncbi:MAG: hypothetical protein CSB55_08950 [Candidatus Cloacimonadota bacterium]|nr:MAG: hypothetical protein CSB55_08950 [Candidatus Cloacimonadota bacterium]